MGGDAAELPVATNVPAASDPAADAAAAKAHTLLEEVKQLLAAAERKTSAPTPAPSITFNAAPIEVKAGDTHVTLPEGCVQVVAEITTPEVKTGDVIINNEAAPAPTVENHVHMPEAKAGPQEVAIVSMPGVDLKSTPARKTETTITRNAAGDMTGSSATEVDQ